MPPTLIYSMGQVTTFVLFKLRSYNYLYVYQYNTFLSEDCITIDVINLNNVVKR